jgi:leader peptidase (prepilin peptidase) / N-methyltransferase
MVVGITLASYAVCATLLSLVALERAQRSQDPFRVRESIAFWIIGGFAVAACAIAGKAEPAIVVIFACLAVCAASDISAGRIYDNVLAPTLVLVSALRMGDGALTAICGGVAALSISAFLYAASGGRGLGFGDVKLFGLSGLALGPIVVGCIGVAFVLGAAYATVLLATRRAKRNSAIPFAPYIALAAMGIECFR